MSNFTYEWMIDHEPGGMYGPGHWAYTAPFWDTVALIGANFPHIGKEQIAHDLAVALQRDWIKGVGEDNYHILLNDNFGDLRVIDKYSRFIATDQSMRDLPLFAGHY